MDIKAYMAELGSKARIASRHIAKATTAQKNEALLNIADSIGKSRDTLLAANQQDLAAGKEKGLEAALLDRLELTDSRVNSMLEGIRQVAALDDPVGEISDLKYRPSGIQVGRMRVPLGVIGIIYESRPNVTCEAASLCLKSGNATILRGGSEAINSNRAIADCINSGLDHAGMNEYIVQVINSLPQIDQSWKQRCSFPNSLVLLRLWGSLGTALAFQSKTSTGWFLRHFLKDPFKRLMRH